MKYPTKKILSFGQSAKNYFPNKETGVASFLSLYQYANGSEKALVWLGILAGIISGIAFPMFILMYGEFSTALLDRKTPNATFHTTWVLGVFGGGRTNLDGTPEDLANAIREDSNAYGFGMLAICLVDVVFSFMCVAFLNYSALTQISRIRRSLIRAVLQKEIAWYDVNSNSNFAVNLTEDLNFMQEGMGEKVGLFLNKVSSFIVSLIIALLYGWKLTLVIISCVPIIIISNGLTSKLQATMVVKEQKAYSNASSVAEEAFSSIKTVVAFDGAAKEVEKYWSKLQMSQKTGIRRSFLTGLGNGIMWLIINCVYALAFWYGVTLILESRANGDDDNSPASIIIAMFGVVAGSMNMGQCLPYLEAFSMARGSATAVFNIIKAKSLIDPLSKSGKTLDNFVGKISFSNVQFNYPARTAVQVLKGLTLDIASGSKVALVGSSGCGKSTCIQLIQRLYDPSKGAILLDGVDLRELNIHWLRSQIGVVSQEPLLFATTIYENIRYGMISATKEDIENAAKMANAHDFITKLPQGYQTMIGQRGTQLSGGQKQRIAIARAVVRNPKILLLDEATSALDSQNETIVQNALDSAAKGRTTIVVAHRLSTVKNADRIIVLGEGQFQESGTHEELIKLQGQYYKLLNTQKAAMEGPESKPEDSNKDGAYTQFTETTKEEEMLTNSAPEETDDDELIGEAKVQGGIWRILSYSKPEWLSMLVGSLATIVVGCSSPLIAILVGEIYGVLANDNMDEVRSGTDFISGMMVVLAVSVGVSFFLQLFCFGHVATNVTTRIRKLTFAAILRQEPAWFDKEENKVGALSARLSSSAADIQAIAGSSLSVVLQGLTTIIIGFAIAFMYSWQLTLVTSVGLPILFFGVYYEFYVVQGQNLLDKKNIESATKIAVEAINGIRTVASLGREDTIMEKYNDELKDGEAVMKKKAFMRGFIYAVGQSATFLGYTISLWYGGFLVADDLIGFQNVIKVSEALLFGVWLLGQSLAFAPSFGKAKLSAGRLFEILDRECVIKDGNKEQPKGWQPEGVIDYSKVKFCYPNRPEVQVLQDFTLKIKPGTSIAMAGASGCGKSTVIQLLQRFYDPDAGTVSLDSTDIKDYKTSQLRSYMSIVQQEPILFNATIGENIAYGDNSRTVSQEEIIEAAKTANIHTFIVALPSGYETNLGKGGTQLSGGQKQRIAIARALIRNPRILLLDEATSALDTTSEAVVQAALNAASEGRTTITVGHRLASLAQADVICVLDRGRIVEQGTYAQLSSSNSVFATLNQH